MAFALTPKEERELFQTLGRIEGKLDAIATNTREISAQLKDTAALANRVDGKLDSQQKYVFAGLAMVGGLLISFLGACVFFFRERAALRGEFVGGLAAIRTDLEKDHNVLKGELSEINRRLLKLGG